MPPPAEAFRPSELPERVKIDAAGKFRKTDHDNGVDLKRCELLEMTQYYCEVERPEQRDAPVKCWPVQRLFRKCQDKKGSFMVETTAWEGSAKATDQI